jgi:hypothetical protein
MQDRVVSLAIGEGVKYGMLAAGIAGLGVLAATHKYGRFKKYMSISAKTSLPVMSGLFIGSLTGELSLIDAKRNPSKWGLTNDAVLSKKVDPAHGYMPIHHRLVNSVNDNPFRTIAVLGFPVAAYIAHQQSKVPNLKISQRVMHSRVFAQGSILLIAMTVMGVKSYIEKHGRFPEIDD